ncbi:hypothetical protein ACG2LH_15785 [Zhouia sp. PK063]|uniref:hypothetical protein n=1 Tax=Zhouia sp. PK063 TaxID=3373602 RepID=UPI00379EF9C4
MQEKFNIVFGRLKELRVNENDLCKSFWLKILRLKDNFQDNEAWSLLTDNIEWLLIKNVITTNDLVSWFTEEELNKHGVYSKDKVKVQNKFAIGIKNAMIESYGLSKVILFDRAKAKCYDYTFVKGYNESDITIKEGIAEGFHDTRIVAKGYSKVEGFDSCFIALHNTSVARLHDKSIVISKSNRSLVIE